MSIPNRTYAELLDRIEALTGKDSFTSNEQTRILSLVNQRVYAAYRRCDYWPRYITIGEARPVIEDGIPYTQADTVTVSGAGYGAYVDGLYTKSGTANGRDKYTLNNQEISWDGSQWLIRFGMDTVPVIAYYSNDNVQKPWLVTTWVSADPLIDPVPTVTGATYSDIDTFFRIYTGVVYGNGQTGVELDFYVDSDGAHPINNRVSYTQLYVTYKAPWEGPYTDSATNIPLEFFEYAAQGVLADWLRSSGNYAEAQQQEAAAEAVLNFELMRKQVQYNANLYAPRFNTYISRQARNV